MAIYVIKHDDLKYFLELQRHLKQQSSNNQNINLYQQPPWSFERMDYQTLLLIKIEDSFIFIVEGMAPENVTYHQNTKYERKFLLDVERITFTMSIKTQKFERRSACRFDIR